MNRKVAISNARKRMLKERRRQEADFERDAVLDLKVSVVPMWQRIVLFCVGFVLCLSGIYMMAAGGWFILSTFLIVIGFGTVVASIWGGRRSIRAIQAVFEGAGDVADSLWDI